MVEVSGSPGIEDVTVDGTPIVIGGTAVASLGVEPPSSPTLVPLSVSDADEQTTREIERAVQQFAACGNTGDALRVYALFTEDGLRNLLANVVPEDAETFINTVATPVAIPPEALQPAPIIESIQMLEDGRVAATLVITSADGGETRQTFVYSIENER